MRGTGDLLLMEDAGPLCMDCSDLDHLVFLPAGDPALTRRARVASGLSAVVVRFSRSRGRYERQGLLVEEVRRKQPKVYKQWQEHPETVQPPEGETLAEARERAEEVLTKLARKHRSGTIALVAAEPLASVIRQRIDAGDIGDLWRAANGCSHFDVLTLEAGLPAKISATSQNGAAVPVPEKLAAMAPTNGQAKMVYRGVPVEGH